MTQWLFGLHVQVPWQGRILATANQEENYTLSLNLTSKLAD